MRRFTPLCALSLLMLAPACATVKLEAPEKPIEINLNVNIEHRVKVEIDKDLDRAMENDAIF